MKQQTHLALLAPAKRRQRFFGGLWETGGHRVECEQTRVIAWLRIERRMERIAHGGENGSLALG
jgi:hypothetical protein